MAYHEEVRIHQVEDAQGNVTVDQTSVTRSIIQRTEPDYIKIYTRMWCEFNEIPDRYRPLFLSLVMRMTYANLAGSPHKDANEDDTQDEDQYGGQIVYTIGPARKAIMRECGWEKDNALSHGLQKLVECNAIRRISRGVYQINPHYAGRGKWKYDAKANQGGVENLIAVFDFAAKTVKTQITWASDNPMEIGPGNDQVVATHTTITNPDPNTPENDATSPCIDDIGLEVNGDTTPATECATEPVDPED